ncbi:MAG: glycerol-3-phosphate 1-O-acyltransferase PlsY [Geminicoccaceae bacterium]
MIEPLGGPVYWLPFVIGFAVAYLIGSIPFGLLFTRWAGAGDIRAIGSGNIGATNVLRTGRKDLAIATLLADALKGAVPCLIAFHLFGPNMATVVALGAVVGHCFPVYLRFKGGKAVATAAGVVFALAPLAGAITLALFVLVVWLSRYVSLGSMVAAMIAGPIAFFTGKPHFLEVFLAIGLLIVAKHHTNIRRLIQGNENRLGVRANSNSD